MKKVFKGFLIAILIFIGLIILVSVGIYFYSKTPNDIVVSSSPILFKDIKDDIAFPIGEIPSYIRNADSKNIIYQASYIKDDWVRNCVYICVLRPNLKSFKLKRMLPVKGKDLDEINKTLLFHKLTNPFSPTLDLPDNMETDPGIRLKVFNPKNQEKLNLNSGSYEFITSESIDKEGYYTEVIIYDQKSNLLYYERMRFHAFQ